MTSDSLVQTLEEHFVSLNRMVRKSLEAAVKIHRETIQGYSAAAKKLQGQGKEGQKDQELIQRTLDFHQTNLEVCNSLFTEIAAETHLTGMLSDLKQEHEKFLEKLPVKMPVPELHADQVYRQFLLPLYLNRLAELVLETRKEISASLTILLKDELIELPEFRWKERYESLLGRFLQEKVEEFGELLQKSGSPLSITGLKLRFKRGVLTHAFSKLASVERSWRTTFYAFYEDWRFREQLFTFIQEVRLLKLEVSDIFSGRIRTTLYPELEKQKTFISRILNGLPDPDKASMEELRSYLVKELYRLNKEKKQQSQEGTAYEAAEGIPGILQKMESVILEKLQDFPPKVGVVYSPDYQKGIRQSEIRYFSPREFLEFNSLAEFLQVHKKLQTDLGKLLEKLVREFREFDQIVDFYLDSAIALTHKSGIKEEEVITIFREGLKRLEGISDKSKKMLGDLEQKQWSEISANTETFIDSVRKLDNNDNILNIYTQLIKSKALISSVQKRKRLVSGLKTATGRISKFTSQNFSWLRASYEDIRKRLKLNTSSATITSEISNYLAGILKRITELPVIYQHLFDPAPVHELNLFLSREEDTGKLDRALADWEKGNFAATLVTGEAGSGCSSLLQHYARTLKSQYPILSFQVDKFYCSEDDFYSLIGDIFNQEGITDENTLANFVSTLTEKIVIVDGLERLFMRKVNGFVCLRKFLSLVVNTNKSVFWICSVSKIAYHYLNRTMALSEHFDYILDIDNLKGSDIREIIMKRNRLSGYSLFFMNSTEDSDKGSIESQEELEDMFFADLERFTGSNIGLSLIYWLQSVQSVGEEGIKVGRFSVPDFEFLENISARKTFVLLLVVMHRKISVGYHALASNCSLEESSGLLSLLKEDSILILKDGYYFLNGILYRHSVKLLRDRNLIH